MRIRRQGQGPNRLLPRSCNNVEFYDNDDAVFNGSQNNRLRRALDTTFDTLNAESASNSECVEPVQQYLCHYYFPLCNMTTGEVIPVCNNTCKLLFDNNDCSDLLILASQELSTHNVPVPDQSCSRTHQPFIMNPPSISHKCTDIKGRSLVQCSYTHVRRCKAHHW